MLDDIDLDMGDVLGEEGDDSSAGGPVAHWLIGSESPFWGTPTLRDIVPKRGGAGGSHGTLTNGPVWQGALGRPGGRGSLLLNTVEFGNKAIKVSGTPTIANDVTIGLWLKTTDTYADRGYIGRWDGAGYMLYSTGTDVRLYGGSAAENIVWTGGTAVVADNIWHLLVGVKTGTTGIIYLDGVEKANAAGLGASNGTPADVFNIGSYLDRYGSSISCLAGSVDESFLYSRALSAAEVAQLYQRSRQGYPSRRQQRRPQWVSVAAPGGFIAFPRPRGLRSGMSALAGGL